MYFAIFRNTKDGTLPPALARSDTADGIRNAKDDNGIKGWECIFICEGEEIDLRTFFDEKK